MKRIYDLDEATGIAASLGIDFSKSRFDLEQFRSGLDVEAEHGNADPSTNVTNDDPLTTGKIALAHLNEFPDYYTRLARMEADAARGDTTQVTSEETNGSESGSAVKKAVIGLALLAFGVAAVLCLRTGRCSRTGRTKQG